MLVRHHQLIVIAGSWENCAFMLWLLIVIRNEAQYLLFSESSNKRL
jgi:hypothetical protein